MAPLVKLTNYIKKYTPQYTRRSQFGLTEAERQLMPFISQEKAKAAEQRNLLQPVETLFDLLSRGQYFSANIGEQIIRNWQNNRPLLEDVPREAWEGIIGKQKGDWEKVLFGGQAEGGEPFSGAIPWEPETGVGKFLKGAAGFAANVALDPTTYIGFGPAKGARAAATGYADDIVRLTIRNIGKNVDEIFPQLVQKGFNKEVFAKTFAQNAKKGLEYFSQYAGEDITKYLNKIRKEAYKKGLRTPGKQLAEELGGVATQEKEQLLSGIAKQYEGKKSLSQMGKYYAEQEALSKPGQALEYLNRLIQGEPYAGAGQRAVRVLGQEFFRGERYPGIVKSLDQVKEAFEKSKIGGLFSDAWWAINNKPGSPVSLLKKAFGIRNPYQKMLRIMELDVLAGTPVKISLEAEKIHKILEPLSEDERKMVFYSMARSQTEAAQLARVKPKIEKKALKAGQAPKLETTKSAVQIAGEALSPGKADNITKAINDLNKMSDSWMAAFRNAQSEGLAGDIGEIEDYLPILEKRSVARRPLSQLGEAAPRFTRQRQMTWGEHIQRQIEKAKWLFGLDDETAQKLIFGGAGELNVDLERMFVRRAMGQYRWEQRIEMVKKFREFGFDVTSLQETNPQMFNYLTGAGAQIEKLGLKPIQGKGLENYLFDKDTAEILERAIDVSSNDETLKALGRALNGFTNWWKGWATLSPGFHMRNLYSNNITGILKFGPKWLNPGDQLDAIAATAYGLYGDRAVNLLKATGISEGFVTEFLNKQIGDKTMKELIDTAKAKGVISHMTMGFDQPQTIKDLIKQKGQLWNPFSPQFGAMKGSRAIGNMVESTPRMQSFLMDYKDLMKSGVSPDRAMEFAKTEAKKWFIDYSDLTPFEKKVMKNVIPFYTWLRHNLANQLLGITQFTDMYAALPKATRAVSGGQRVEGEEMPDWMRELGMFPIGDEKGMPLMFWPNFPYQDINKIPLRFRMTEGGIPIPAAREAGEAVRDIAASAHPLIKSVIQSIPEEGWDVFYKKPLGDLEKAPRLARVFSKSPRLLSFLDGAMRSLGYENGLRAQIDKEGRLVIDARVAKLLDDNIPLLDQIPKFWDLPELIFPAMEEWKQKAFGAKDDYEGLEELLQTLSFWGGIKIKKLNPEEERTNKLREIYRKAEEARRKEMKKYPAYEKRKLDYINRSLKRMRKLGLG